MSLASHRPRTVGEIVDTTFNLYREHFATIITVAMLFVAPPAILKFVVPAELARIVELIGNLLVPIAQGAITCIIIAAIERNESLTGGDALRSVGGQAGSLIAVQLAGGLMVFIGLILLVVPGVIALVWTAVALPVVMAEQLGYSKAIDRSRALARGRWKHVLGTLLLSWGVALLIIVGVGFVVGMLAVGERTSDVLVELLFGVGLPIPTIAMALLYYDLRVRTESADLEAMISTLPAPIPG
jgi:predicted membrane protein